MKKIKTFLEQQKNGLIQLITNEYSLYLLLSMILFKILWNQNQSKFWNPIIFLLFVVYYILFIYNVSMNKEISVKENWLDIIFIIIIVASWFIYTFTLINSHISIYLIILLMLFILIFLIYRYFVSLLNQRKLVWIIFYYVLLSILIVITFALIYQVIFAFNSNNTILVSVQNESINTTGDYIYFSAQTYLLNSYGEYYPHGQVMRWATIIESAFTFIITGFVINDILNNKNKNKT